MIYRYTDLIDTSMDKYAAFRLRFNSRGIPVWQQLWKWLTAQKRANKLQVRLTQRQEKLLPYTSVKEIVAQQGLPKEFERKFVLDPTTADNLKFMQYDFHNKMISNNPLYLSATPSSQAKLTDSVLHEIGHARTHINGAVSESDMIKSLIPSLTTALRRLINPDASDCVRIETLADKAAFGTNGKLSWHKQLRHHPAIGGYRAGARMLAGAQLVSTGVALGAMGYEGAKLYDRHRTAHNEELAKNDGKEK